MEENNSVLQFVTDENGQKHYLQEKIGQGGQGAVWKTADPNVIIKMKVNPVTGESIVDEKEYDKYRAELDEVRILDWPKGVNIAKVASILQKPYCGYTMRMLGDMKPIKYWIRSFGKTTVPPKFYRETGGLRSRLIILTKAAEIFAKLNYHSIVYADLSPENLFVSSTHQSSNVWLIDADNMRYYFDMSKQVYTPGYGAPEVAAGGINTLASDAYTFAILAHEVLTLNSPFAGAMQQNADDDWDDGWDDTEEESDTEDTYIPWIYDETDTGNSVPYGMGMSSNIVFTEGLRKLFARTFSREGQMNPDSRPSMREWFEELRHAQDLVITCEHCGNSYYIRSQKKTVCPICNKKRERFAIYAQILDEYDMDTIINMENASIDEFNKDNDFTVSHISKEDLPKMQQVGKRIFDDADGIYGLYNYHVDDLSFFTEREDAIVIEIKNGKYTIWNATSHQIQVSSQSKSYGEINSKELKKFDEIDRLILTLPVTYGRKNIEDTDVHVVDDLSIIRKRHVKFYKL